MDSSHRLVTTFFWRDRRLRDAVTAMAVVLSFLVVLGIIVAVVAGVHWWPLANPARPDAVQPAAKTTRRWAFREVTTSSACPPETDCFAVGAAQVRLSALYALADGAVAVNASVGSASSVCTTVGNYNNTALGDWQLCRATHIFIGAGGIAAGTLVSQGLWLNAYDASDARGATWAVTGGTLPYAQPGDGALFLVADAGAPATQRDVSLTFVSVD